MIVISVDDHLFKSEFKKFNRQDNFSDTALDALFCYYEELSEQSDTPYKLDVIEICSEWTEYDSIQEAFEADNTSIEELVGGSVVAMLTASRMKEYGNCLEAESLAYLEVSHDCDDDITEHLESKTTVIHLDGGGVLIQAY